MFAFIPAFARKAIPLAFAGLLLAACQSSGLKPGAMTTVGFPPAGWETEVSGSEIMYFCDRACKRPQGIIVSPVDAPSLTEAALRDPEFRTKVLDAYMNAISIEHYEAVVFGSSKKTVSKNFANLEMNGYFKTNIGLVYFNAYYLVQGERKTGVFSFAFDKATAARNIKLFGQNTRVVRIP